MVCTNEEFDRRVKLIDEHGVAQKLHKAKRLVVLTGAGASAESGIPTFRCTGGYWTEGSENYRGPEHLATWEAYNDSPEELWKWYQYRWNICSAAEPNAGHRALVDLEGLVGGKFLLVTQNIDGLHKKAGSDPKQLCEVHGRIDEMRCDERVPGACLHGLDLEDEDNFEIARSTVENMPKPAQDEKDEKLPICSVCGVRQRPKMLWFDESYNEALYRSQTAVEAAEDCDVMLVVGTQLTTRLPLAMVLKAAANGATIIRIDPQTPPDETVESYLDELKPKLSSTRTRSTRRKREIRETTLHYLGSNSGEALPRIVDELRMMQAVPGTPTHEQIPGTPPKLPLRKRALRLNDEIWAKRQRSPQEKDEIWAKRQRLANKIASP